MLTHRALMLNARKNEAVADNEGVGTEGSLSPGEVYSSKRPWGSEEFQRADAELKGEKTEKRTTLRRECFLRFPSTVAPACSVDIFSPLR